MLKMPHVIKHATNFNFKTPDNGIWFCPLRGKKVKFLIENNFIYACAQKFTIPQNLILKGLTDPEKVSPREGGGGTKF